MHTIKPIDKECIIENAEKIKNIFTLEEHSVIGGLGTAVAEVLAETELDGKVKFKRFGLTDVFAPCTGTREYLLKQYGIGQDDLVEKIETLIRTNK